MKYPDLPEALICIVRPDRHCAIAPMNMLNEMLMRPSEERTGLLLYNLLSSKDRHEDEIPYTYTMV